MNGFWWLFYYALSSGNPRVCFETFKHYYYCEFNLLGMDFGGSFTTPCHLEILVPTFYYALSSGNARVSRVYFETFKHYYY